MQHLITHLTTFAAECEKGSLFGIPTWYKYLRKNPDDCSVIIKFNGDGANPNDIWLVLLGVIDILLYLGGVVAVGYLIYGGVLYMVSQGEPDKTNSAKTVMLNAVIGLVIVLFAVPLVAFVGGQL